MTAPNPIHRKTYIFWGIGALAFLFLLSGAVRQTPGPAEVYGRIQFVNALPGVR
jgi:hypothetical protein